MGAYAVSSSLITLVRFIPDALSRILIARNYNSLRIPKLSKVFSIILSGVIVVLAIELTRSVITLLLGSEWLVPYSVFLFMALHELLRGWYQIKANRLIAEGLSVLVHKTSLLIPVLALITCLLSIQQLGLIAAPITFSVGYLVGLWSLGKIK